jgi:PAS domain S-box-containing protein
MVQLDITTITVVASIVSAALACAVFIQYKVNKTYDGLGWWLSGAIVQAIGFFLMPTVSIPAIRALSALANPCVLSGQMLVTLGIVRFLGGKKNGGLFVSLFVAYILAYAFFIVVDDSIQGRTIAVNASTSIISLVGASTLFAERKRRFSDSIKFMASVFFAYGCLQAAMTAATLIMPPLNSYAEISSSPIRTAAFILPIVGSVLWTFAFIIMVNQRLNTENIEEKEKLKLVFEISPDAKLITRMSDGLIVDVNAGFLAITGHPREEIVGAAMQDIDVWSDLGDRRRFLEKVARQGSVENEEFYFNRKDGRKFIGILSGRKIMIDEQAHIIAVVYDITERKQAEQKVAGLLQEKNLILKEVHHRIKNNMSTIYSLLSLQAETLKDPVSVMALDDARNRIRSMMMLYDKLYKSGLFNELSVKEYFPTLIDEIIGNFPNAEAVRIEKNLEEFALGINTLQPLGIIINELLTNIMKYAFIGRADGIISVSATLRGDQVSMVIADNGNGMPESVDFENSTGFGLVLVKALTQQIGGTIGIERGNGTKIRLEFKRRELP